MKLGTIVRRIQGQKKYGVLPKEALKTDWIVIGYETLDGKLWYRCTTPKNLARVGNEKDEWGKVCTLKTDSTIFQQEEVADTGRVYPL